MAQAQQEKLKLEGEAATAKLQERMDAEKLSKKLLAEGKLEDAFVAANRTLAIERELFEEDNEAIGSSIAFLADLAEYRDLWDEAIERRKIFYERIQARYGQDHWKAIDARLALEKSNLLKSMTREQRLELRASDAQFSEARKAKREKNYQFALQLNKTVLAVRKEILGEKHLDYAETLNNLAVLYYTLQDYAKAEPLFSKTLEIKKIVVGEKHPEYAVSLNNLARVYDEMGDYAKAEPLHLQALEIRRVAFGEKHLDYAETLNNLASVYGDMGDYAKAEPLYLQALEIKKVAMGDYAKAEPLLLQANRIWKIAFGERHPDYAIGLNNLAHLYCNLLDYAKAESLYAQARRDPEDSVRREASHLRDEPQQPRRATL